MKRGLRLAVCVPLALVVACGKDAPAPTPVPPTAAPAPVLPSSGAPSPTGDPAKRAAEVVGRLSDEDLAGQVLMPYAYGSAATRVDKASAAGNQTLAGVDTPAEMITKFRLGGLILVGFTPEDPTGATNPTTNVESPKQVRELTAGL